MLYHLMILLLVLTFFFTLLSVLFCISCCGLTSVIKKILGKLNLHKYDNYHSADVERINRDCYICMENIQNEVLATCNHGYCGNSTV